MSCKKLSVDLQHYFSEFIATSQLNRSSVPRGPIVDVKSCSLTKSFIRLLFDDGWDDVNTSYRYLYRTTEDRLSIPTNIRERAMIYPKDVHFYLCDLDDTSKCDINLFDIQPNDRTLLDALLYYRTMDSSNMTLLVTESTLITDPIFINNPYPDSTATLIVNYYELSNLSKLIYLFLNLEINNDYSRYNNLSLIADVMSVLENSYECYVLEKMFLKVKDQKV